MTSGLCLRVQRNAWLVSGSRTCGGTQCPCEGGLGSWTLPSRVHHEVFAVRTLCTRTGPIWVLARYRYKAGGVAPPIRCNTSVCLDVPRTCERARQNQQDHHSEEHLTGGGVFEKQRTAFLPTTTPSQHRDNADTQRKERQRTDTTDT